MIISNNVIGKVKVESSARKRIGDAYKALVCVCACGCEKEPSVVSLFIGIFVSYI